MAIVPLKSSDDRMSSITTAMKKLDSDVEIVSSEGDILLANSFLLSLASPFLQSLLLPLLPTDNQTSARIHLPDISKRSLSHLFNILKQGYSTGLGAGNSIREEVQEAARALEFTELPVLSMSSNYEYFEEAGEEYEKMIKSEMYCIENCKEETCDVKDIKLEVKKEMIKYEFESPKKEGKEIGKEADRYENNYTIATNVVEPAIPSAQQEPQQPSNAYSPRGNKAGPAETKRKLPERKRKVSHGSFFDNSEEDCSKVKRGEKKRPKLDDEVHDDDEYRCNKCNFKSKYKGNVKAHHESVHDKVKYPCSQCEYKATTNSSLNKHMKSVHEGVLFACSQCDYEATTKSSLSRHVKSIHERIKYQCFECKYEATRKSMLIKHNMRVHNKRKHVSDYLDMMIPKSVTNCKKSKKSSAMTPDFLMQPSAPTADDPHFGSSHWRHSGKRQTNRKVKENKKVTADNDLNDSIYHSIDSDDTDGDEGYEPERE